MNSNGFLDYLANTLKSPSTYAGLSSLLLLFHITLPAWMGLELITSIGTAVAGVLAVVIKSRSDQAK